MQHPVFTHCPSCGAPELSFNGVNRFSCRSCNFSFFQNTATGCGAILTWQGKILLLERGKEPARGLLDYPGGFVDPGESAEEALQREITEETGLVARGLSYLCSAANRYQYNDVLYTTCDLIFTGVIDQPPLKLQESEISAFGLYAPEEIELERIAFPSLRYGMKLYLERFRSGEIRYPHE